MVRRVSAALGVVREDRGEVELLPDEVPEEVHQVLAGHEILHRRREQNLLIDVPGAEGLLHTLRIGRTASRLQSQRELHRGGAATTGGAGRLRDPRGRGSGRGTLRAIESSSLAEGLYSDRLLARFDHLVAALPDERKLALLSRLEAVVSTSGRIRRSPEKDLEGDEELREQLRNAPGGALRTLLPAVFAADDERRRHLIPLVDEVLAEGREDDAVA